MNKRIASVFIIVVFLTLLLSAFSCRNTKSQPYIDTDYEKILPCWIQKWDVGHWEPIETSNLDAAYASTESGKQLCISCCKNCDGIRVMNPENKMQRVLVPSGSVHKKCEHIWIAGFGKQSFISIKSGDMIFIIFNKMSYAVSVDEISWNKHKIAYRISEIGNYPSFPIIQIDGLKWKKQEAEYEIPFAKRKFSFLILPPEQQNDELFITFQYDQYYGGVYGPETQTIENSAHIGIVHKDDLNESSLVDLAKIRFKTWEDGLGNKCEEVKDPCHQ